MPDHPRSRSRRPGLLAAAVLGVALTVLSPLVAALAWAAPQVTVTYPQGTTTADPDYATKVTVSGSGFQSIKKGFGGIYVLFGWVKDPSGGSWRPSNGGVVGADYRYVPDQESKDNAGFQRFVSFPGSETESAAQAIMADDGSWKVDMVIPGAVFESRDRDNKVTEVDCRTEQCGIITIGAHGVKNSRNESFTPVSFGAAGAGAGAATSTPTAAAAAPTAARVGYTPSSAVAGDALTFTGQGFTPGEQVVAQLDDGAAAVGPLTAGPSGEVAGVLALPADLRGGTHALTLMGAASGKKAQSELTITAAKSPDAQATASDVPAWVYLVLGLFVLVALVMVLLSVVTSVVRWRRRRRAARRAAAPSTDLPAANPPSAEPPTELLPTATEAHA